MAEASQHAQRQEELVRLDGAIEVGQHVHQCLRAPGATLAWWLTLALSLRTITAVIALLAITSLVSGHDALGDVR